MIDQITVKGNLRIEATDQSTGVNAPGTVSLKDDEHTAIWMDPDGAIAGLFHRDPQAARAMFLDNKRRAAVKRSNRKGR